MSAVSRMAGRLPGAAASSSRQKTPLFPLSFLLPRLLSTAADIFCDLLSGTPNPPGPDLEKALTRVGASKLDLPTVESVLRHSPSSTPAHRLALLRFFVWAGVQPVYRHSAAAYAVACERLQLSRHPEHLVGLLDAYRSDGVPVTARTFRILFNLCRGTAGPEQALRLLRRMGEFDCRPDTAAYNTVLRLLMVQGGSVGNAEVAERLLEEMALAGVHPDIVTCMSMVKGFCDAGRFGDARSLVGRMRARGCSPNVVVYSALVDGACKCGNIEAAMELLGEMESGTAEGCAPNVVTYTCLMKCLCENGKAKEAMEVLDRMVTHGCSPNRVTVITLLKGLCGEGMLEEAFKLVEWVVRQCSFPSENCYSSLVMCLLQHGQVQEAEKLLKRMLETGLTPDGSARNGFLRELCSARRFLDGVLWVEEMWKKGLVFDMDVYSSLLAGVCEKGQLPEAMALVKGMTQRGIHVSPPCLDSFVVLLRKSGESDLAQQILGIRGS
ncbi:hypothetical protein Taro_042979 [Colocasia esculenta]|uniref:Pentatricopeptide repeat-containing protein n=1 Tax=Colocasia esculenta TaxID=4460 RepID=A0A843X3F8_COLES|nr:hypothetical protein [Colocasia esculenta]